jgi:hypothetical protein
MDKNEALKQALALAIVRNRRENAHIKQLESRISQLQGQLEQATERQNISDIFAVFKEDAVLGGKDGCSADTDTLNELQSQLHVACLWEAAAQALPADSQQLLLALQRYLLHKESCCSNTEVKLPTALLLQHTPLSAVAKLLADAVEAQQGLLLAQKSQQQGSSGDLSQQQSPVPLPQLALAVRTISLLLHLPANATMASDRHGLEGLCAHLISIAFDPHSSAACEQPANSAAPWQQQQAQHEQHSAAGVHAASSAAAAAPAEAPSELAEQILAWLFEWPATGFVLLACSTAMLQSGLYHFVQLVAAGADGGTGRHVPAVHAAEQEEEEAVLSTLCQISMLVQQGLRLLPGWVGQQNGSGDEINAMAHCIEQASELCKIVALTHRGLARQVQRAAALFVAALHQISGGGE